MTTFDFTKEIDRGVALLAEHAGPRWFDSINLDYLNLRSGTQCVLGQLSMKEFRQRVVDYNGDGCTCITCAGYGRVVTILRDEGMTEYPSFYGFELPSTASVETGRQMWEELTLQWKERIEKLRADAGTL